MIQTRHRARVWSAAGRRSCAPEACSRTSRRTSASLCDSSWAEPVAQFRARPQLLHPFVERDVCRRHAARPHAIDQDVRALGGIGQLARPFQPDATRRDFGAHRSCLARPLMLAMRKRTGQSAILDSEVPKVLTALAAACQGVKPLLIANLTSPAKQSMSSVCIRRLR
jgi:hypothetical protein